MKQIKTDVLEAGVRADPRCLGGARKNSECIPGMRLSTFGITLIGQSVGERDTRQGVSACSRVKVTDSGSDCARKETRVLLGDILRRTNGQAWEREGWRQGPLVFEIHADTDGRGEG